MILALAASSAQLAASSAQLAASSAQLAASAAQDDRTSKTILHGWHNDFIAFIRTDLPRLVLILILAAIVLRVVQFFVKRMRRLADRQASANPQRASQLRTVASILRATAFSIVFFLVLLHLLSVFKIDVTPILASAGVVGVGVGLGAQSLFKDMLNGLFILFENQFNVGDTVKLAGLSGTVEDLTLRCTTLRDADGTLSIIPNSQIATVSNLSRDFSIAALAIVVDASADPDKVLEVLRATAQSIHTDSAFKDVVAAGPDIPGIDSISGRTATYPVSIRVRVNQKDALLRELRRRIILAFEANSIPLGTDPANLLLRHADPTAPPAQQPLTGS